MAVRVRLAALLALPIAALVAASGLTLLLDWASTPGEPAAPSATTGTTSPSGGPPPPATSVDQLVRQLQGFVERERGLRFKRTVAVSLLEDDAFRARVVQLDDEDREEVEKAQAVLRAMGLIPRSVNLLKTVQDFAGAGVSGLYDPETKELVVRGSATTPTVRVTLVHELAHALEDQHFNFDRQDLGDEAAIGFAALQEGSALRVEDAYVRSLSPGDRAEARREDRAQAEKVPDNVPQVVQIAFGFPYAFGPNVVSALLEAGGKARLDAAFADPPASTEQVLEPQRYLDGDEPRTVPVPKADGPAFDDGEIGQLFLVLMLRAELPDDVARDASEGWGGDRYVAWRDGERTCVRMDFVMDDRAETDELVDALRYWAGKRRGRASSAGTSLTTCG